MKKLLPVILLLFVAIGNAQKIKLKKGKVLVDKKEYLTYKGDDFYSLDGLKLFTLKRESIEKDNPLKNKFNSDQGQGQRRGDRYKDKVKVKYTLVTFSQFKLEYETSLSKSKILKEFYKSEVLNVAGIIDQDKAKAIAYKIYKDVTGKRSKI